ncbi:TRAP family 2,3-diketo-L-gulonate transporter periplasmic 2,3-diketo-L-gulonate-binding protein [Salmonella enterica subsp. enterica serovar Enteritidis str. 642046 4-7]|nr:TRAP family 2,3-diketo-L-gulonate transporter periplasmic 2,3-diketo-L-gulonate-binding protein [Salmonella enterica subsp. enterica serovar Enteritidis str. 642046 4-7]
MKLHVIARSLLIAGLTVFSVSSLAAQSLRFGYETPQTDSQHIAAKKISRIIKRKN